MKREEKQYKRLNLVEEKRGDDEKKKASSIHSHHRSILQTKKYDFLPNAASVSSSLEMMLDKRCWRGATAVLFSNAIKRYQLKINR